MDTGYKYLPLKSQLMSDKELDQILQKYSGTLSKTSGERAGRESLREEEVLLFFIASGGTENDFMELYKERQKSYPRDPVYLIAQAGNNSLPAALEILARVIQENLKGKILYLSGNEEADTRLLSLSVRNLMVYKKLFNTNLGLIGKPSDWLVASSPDLSVVKESWGINTQEFDIAELREIYKETSLDESGEIINNFTSQAVQILEPNETDLSNSVRVYYALKKMADSNNLNSVSVRCFDLLTSDHTTGCYALSKLTDDGIIAGCEGDLVTTIGMLWTYLMFGTYPWMANPSRIDINENRLILAHCTVPRNIVSEYDIRSHYESGIGVGIQGKIEHGPVTLLRLGGKDLKSIWLAEGEITDNGKEENLCRTQVEIRLHDRNKLKELLSNPLGNHIILIHGFFAEDLEEWHNEFVGEQN